MRKNNGRRNGHVDYHRRLGGLIDGDGSILLNKKGYVNIEITLDEKDIQTLAYIKKNLGFGNIKKRTGVKAVRWRTAKKEHIIDLLKNLEGKLLTEQKQKQWKVCLLTHDIKSQEEINFPTQNEIKNIITKTSWLSGFFDAQGHFNIMNKTTLAFHLGQKNKNILEHILNSLSIGHIRQDTNTHCWIFSITNKKGISFILKHFTKYPLHTLKKNNIFTFKRLLNWINKRCHLQGTNSKQYKKIFHLISLFKKKI